MSLITDLLKGIAQLTPGSQVTRDYLQNLKDVSLAKKTKRVKAPDFTTKELAEMGGAENFFKNPNVIKYLGNLNSSNNAWSQLQDQLENPTVNAKFNQMFGISPVEQQRQSGSQLYGISQDKPQGSLLSPSVVRGGLEGTSYILGGTAAPLLKGMTGLGGVASRAGTSAALNAMQGYGASNQSNAIPSTLIAGGLGATSSVLSDLFSSMGGLRGSTEISPENKGLQGTGKEMQAKNLGMTTLGDTTETMGKKLESQAKMLGTKNAKKLPNSPQEILDITDIKTAPVIDLRKDILDLVPKSKTKELAKIALKNVDEGVKYSESGEQILNSSALKSIKKAIETAPDKGAYTLQELASKYGKKAFEGGETVGKGIQKEASAIAQKAIVDALKTIEDTDVITTISKEATKKIPLLTEYLGKHGNSYSAAHNILADTLNNSNIKGVSKAAALGLGPTALPMAQGLKFPLPQKVFNILGSMTGKGLQNVGKVSRGVAPAISAGTRLGSVELPQALMGLSTKRNTNQVVPETQTGITPNQLQSQSEFGGQSVLGTSGGMGGSISGTDSGYQPVFLKYGQEQQGQQGQQVDMQRLSMDLIQAVSSGQMTTSEADYIYNKMVSMNGGGNDINSQIGQLAESDPTQATQLLGQALLSGQMDSSTASTLASLYGLGGKETASQQNAAAKQKVALNTLAGLKSALEQGGDEILALQGVPAQGYNTLAQQYKQAGSNIWDSIARSRTGAAINAAEEKFYKTFIPSIWDTPGNREYKLDQLAQILSSGDIESYLGIDDIPLPE